jgi:hypothetical protein
MIPLDGGAPGDYVARALLPANAGSLSTGGVDGSTSPWAFTSWQVLNMELLVARG